MASRRFDLTWPGTGWKHRSVPDDSIPCAHPAMAVRPDYYDRGWRLMDIYRLVGEEERLDQWFREEGLIGDHREACEKCPVGRMVLKCKRSLKDGFVWACSRNGYRKDPCNHSYHIRRGFFFSGTPCWWDILHYSPAYCWIIKTNWIRTYTLWLVPVLSRHLWWSYSGGFG